MPALCGKAARSRVAFPLGPIRYLLLTLSEAYAHPQIIFLLKTGSRKMENNIPFSVIDHSPIVRASHTPCATQPTMDMLGTGRGGRRAWRGLSPVGFPRAQRLSEQDPPQFDE